MSWRDARAKVDSGFYKQKEKSAFETGFAGAADIIAKSWMQDAANDTVAKKDLLKEQKKERDRIREEQRDEDKKTKGYRNVANSAIAQAQLPNSTEVFEQAFTMAKGGATQSTIYDYFLKGINKGNITIIGPEQGPGMPRNTSILTELESGSGGANALLNQSQTSQFKDINVSTMSIGDVMAFQQKRGTGSYHAWSKDNMPDGTAAKRQGLGSTPAGKYQFVGDTLKDLKKNGTLEALGITDDTIFDEKTQDALFVRYAQDRLKGKVSDDERITEMRNIWEGLKKASDEEVLSVISQVETGVFDEGTAVEDRSMMGGETAVFDTPGREYDPVDISSIKTFEDWSAENTNIRANKLEVDPDFMVVFKARGENLKAVEAAEEVDALFSMDVLLSGDMTAAMLADRIELAKAKGMKVPESITKDILPILNGRAEYTQAELIAMTADKRKLVAKYSTDPKSREAAARINAGDIASYSWISEASGSADVMTAKAKEFFQAGDMSNFNLASTMATSLRNGEAQYKDLLKPTYLVGRTLQELSSIKRIAENGGATTKELVALGEEITAAQSLFDSSEYRRYAEGATSFDKTSMQISLATKEGASEEIIKALNALASTQSKAAKDLAQVQKNGFGTQALDVVITDENGQKRYGTVYRKPGEEGLVDSAGKPVTSALPMTDMQETAYKTIRTETQKIGNELAIANAAITEGMRTAASAVEIVRNDQRVRGAGGKAALAIRNLVAGGGELLSVAEGLFEGKPDDHEITLEELKATGSFDNEFLNAVVSGNVQNLATETARFQAKMLSLAFQVGRMEGQSGNAMSNQDFKKIMEIVNTGGGAEAFETSLIDYMGTKLKGYDDKTLNLIAGNTNVATFKQDYDFLPIAEPLTMAQYVELRDEESLTSAYQMFSGQGSGQSTETGTGDTPEFKSPSSTAIDFLKNNPNQRAAFDLKFGPGAADKVLSQAGGN